jgi:glycine oxidase
MECIVVGGGIIGMLTARELARAGCQVRIIERGVLGAESSWAGGGILSPLYPWRTPEPVTQLALWGQRQYPDLAEELSAVTGIDPEWERSGLLVLDSNETDRAQSWAARHHLTLELIEDPRRIAALEPACRSTERALWLPWVAQIRNPRLLRALRSDLERRGVVLNEHIGVTGIDHSAGRVSGVRTAGETYRAETVVVAAGAWSARVLEAVDIRIDVTPVRGQMLLYHAAPGAIRRILLAEGHYVIPRRDGCVLVGSTVEDVGFDKHTTSGARSELRQVAEALVPGLACCEIEQHWSGLRPGSAHEIPYICAAPGMQGLYLNTGHFRNGLLLAPASARLMADLIMERRGELDSEPYKLAP